MVGVHPRIERPTQMVGIHPQIQKQTQISQISQMDAENSNSYGFKGSKLLNGAIHR
jgi:hypothetical protein